MVKVLFIHPSKWGRGITAIWIASHSAVLKKNKHNVKLFDCTFYPEWSENENVFNTQNMQYKQTDYEKKIKWKESNLIEDLQTLVNKFKPDIIFWSAFSSHIHGEGEYVSIQYGYEIIQQIKTSALLIAGGLQATADPLLTYANYPKLSCLIRGESELVLTEIANQIKENKKVDYTKIKGIAYKNQNRKIVVNQKQEIIGDMDMISPYDYSLFDNQTLLRPYNGRVLKAIDYEISRGCIFSCKYCVETVVQEYYGFNKILKRGVIHKASGYLRPLLKRLNVDGIGMGIELAAQDFRESELNRFSDQNKIIEAFRILRENNIKRTAYNVIGFPQQDEESIKNTIRFNKLLDPDNITVAFYTPYLGTQQQQKGVQENYFADNEFNLDAQLRTVTRHSLLNKDLLAFYKKNFVKLCREGLSNLGDYKTNDGIIPSE
jgi:radical SAM superfamily enzyme YgiQ (UPF0313 family)